MLLRVASLRPRCVVEQLTAQGLSLINWEVEHGLIDVKARAL
jgi:hypothetical protein